jgi:hypothetical protein
MVTETKPDLGTASCAHHWMIAPPMGPASIGACRRCGRTKEFLNSTEAAMWERSDATERELERIVGNSRAESFRLSDET